MTWPVIAKKDFADAVRAKSLWALSVLFVLFAAGMAYLYAEFELVGGGQEVTGLGLITFLSGASGTLIPIIALLVGYKSIVGERESGSLKLLLGLPHSRADVVLGKLVGRTLVVAVPVLVGFLVAALIGLAKYAQFDFLDFLLFTGLTILLGASFVGIAIGLSSATKSASRAGALAIGFWLVFQFLWDFVPLVLFWVVNGFSMEGIQNNTDWIGFLVSVSPGNGYGTAAQALLPEGAGFGTVGGFLGGLMNPDMFYSQGWFGFLVLAAWVAVPTLLGYFRFNSTDL